MQASTVTDLPGLLAAPPADPTAPSHESLCVLNLGGEPAQIKHTMYYEDSDPTVGCDPKPCADVVRYRYAHPPYRPISAPDLLLPQSVAGLGRIGQRGWLSVSGSRSARGHRNVDFLER